MKKIFNVRFMAAALAVLMLVCAVSCGDGKGSGEKGYSFSYNGVSISIGDEDGVITSLGTPLATDSSAACGGIEGVDCVYVFEGVTVKTTPAKQGNTILNVVNAIELTDDSVRTPEGLAVGNTREDVVEIMGEPSVDMDTKLEYAKGNMKLTFILRSDVVTNIKYSEK